MVININPNRINTTTGGSHKNRQRRTESNDTGTVIVPKRADVNYIPSPESLQTLIRSAVAALRGGKSWDRGTILNLLV